MREVILQAVVFLSLAALFRAQDIGSGSSGDGDLGYRPGNCSVNVVKCHDQAVCVENGDSYTCQCDGDGVTGDGFKDGTGCTLPFKPCSKDKDCPQFAICNSDDKCQCEPGFQGDGRTCEDVDECESNPCDVNAICKNNPGGYECKCDASKGYAGDGFTCNFLCGRHDDCDWPRAKCIQGACECVEGYQGDGRKGNCADIDECADPASTECSEHATCTNTVGDYDCDCNNGYTGDGKTCEPLPRNCTEIRERKNKRFYLIDPDFDGPANQFWVQCLYIRVNDHWATAVIPKGNFPVAAPETDKTLEIEYDPSPEDIKALVDDSAFCSQEFSFSCTPGYSLFPGTTWNDANGNAHNSWGSSLEETCTCGELQQCDNACYCDGSQTDASTMDEARVVDKSKLPLVSVDFAQGQADKGRVDVEPLMCGSKPIYIPKDCHEAKEVYGFEENTAMYIDLDGQEPFLVFCDMESYEHVGITQIPPSNGNPVQVTTEEGETIEYTVDSGKMKALIEGSVFCSQRVEFQCKNSKLGGADGGAVWVTGEKQKLDYFPGGAGKPGSCACGATESCDDKAAMCNCNIDDGQERKDFGLIIDRSDLPVTKVTAQVGNSRSSTYEIGELRCSQKQFGFEPNCEKLHAIGVSEDYTYFIDSDGTGGQDPFPAGCDFIEDPSQGKTIIHHDNEGPMTVTTPEVTITYLMASPGQIEALMKRSTFCTQEVSVDCQQFTVSVDPGTILWTGGAGAPTGSLKLSDYLDSCGPNGDACKCSDQGEDSGTITDKSVLPINKLDFSSISNLNTGGSITVDVGPLVCSEVFPTCKHLWDFYNENALEGEATVVNGRFTSDPDGAGGVPPFTVECTFPESVIAVEGEGSVGPEKNDPLEPVSKCFDISYKSATGASVSPAQVAAYAAKSTSCSQTLSLKCRKAPATKMVNYTTCDGKTQVGWAGSYGQDSCACGVNGNCDGGRDALCNCDSATNKWKEDFGEITQKDRLPVCQVCLSIDPPANGRGWTNPLPELSFEVSELVCDRPKKGLGSCQAARRESKVKDNSVEQMAALDLPGGGPSVPIGCKLFREPPLGILTVKPADPTYPRDDDNKVDIVIRYITINITVVGQVLSEQRYCSQKIFLYCAGDNFNALSGSSSWYDRDGNPNQEWTKLADDGEDVVSNCESNPKLCTDCGNPKGYIIKDKDLLPVSRLVLDGSGIGVVVENTECFDLLSSCQEIYDVDDRKIGFFGKNRYIIDVDGPGPLRPLRVLCEFDKTTDNGVTVVEIGGEWESSDRFEGQDDDEEDFDLEVEYRYATHDQINALANISDFCWQGVKYECKKFPLLEDPTQPSSYYRLYDGQPASSFGTGQDVDFPGCACHKLDFCYTAMSCNCDAEGSTSVDQGAITDRESLPITGVRVASQSNPNATANFRIGSVRCSGKSTALPKDCAEAYEWVSKDGVDYTESGEYLISPNPDVIKPFMVFCDFTTGKGVTMFRPDFPKENPLPTNSSETPTDVPYNGVDEDQIKAVVERSAYCYQGVRFDCYKTAFLSGGSYFQSTDLANKWKFWGGGEPGPDGATGTCACGDDDACAGLDSSEGQRTRPCNCDLVDEENRKDAGVIDIKAALPVTSFQLGAVSDMSQASLTVGDLYCAQEPLNLNECELGFYDCDPRAECQDMEEGYHCVCPDGWQGLGVVTDSSLPTANGRQCIDDDECEAFSPCSYYADCTNLPGSYNCTCKEGFTATSETDCEDVDECAEGTDDCGENAFCDNLIGSYRCICNKGFRGDGKECVPIGQCSCFGDPHCNSFDDKVLHYQGDCSYIMAKDGCGEGSATFEVRVEMWRKGQDAAEFKYSWVKTVTVLVGGKTIRLEQGPRLVVDGQVVSQYIDSYRLRVVQINRRIKLTTFEGLEVSWDGADRVSVTVPQEARGNTCGLCGDYDGNPDNDWTVGPACAELEGKVTDNYVLFGDSWTVETEGECAPVCDETEAPPPPEECEHESKAVVEEKCEKLFSVSESVFKDCLKTKDQDYLDDLEFACNFDVCASSEELDAKLCRVAETIAKECAEIDKIPIKNWRESVHSCEEVECPNNQEYSDCGPAEPPTCFTGDDTVSATVCEEGCFCPTGTLLEGDKCITEEQCGCYHEGNYIPTDEKVILRDCTAEIKCEGLNQTSSEPVECGVNEECRTDEGVTDCYCIEGYILVDGVCEDETCVGIECGDYEQCVNGTCECIPGYREECGICVDIDECAIHQHDCDYRGQKCVNVPGTFRCDCEAGYTADGNRCKDVNECETLNAPCKENSECVNTLGGYVCECCAGYKHAANGHCVRDTTKTKASEGRCCACQGAMCATPGKVCGTDGETYSSYRALSIHACRVKDDSIKFNYMGNCQASCDDICCERNYAVCKVDNEGVPQCMCPHCGNNPSNAGEVCGSDGETYSGVCQLKKAACEDENQDMIKVESQGSC